MTTQKKVRLVALSGTMTSKSIRDYAHLLALALGEGAPVPLHWPTVMEWATAIDEKTNTSSAVAMFCNQEDRPIGALAKIARGGENARQAYMRRLRSTFGVVSSAEGALGTSLNIVQRKSPELPAKIKQALVDIASLEERPDGEQFTEALQVAACLREVSSGFFYKWRFPRAEPNEVREKWLRVRKDYRKEVREYLKFSHVDMDSPLIAPQGRGALAQGIRLDRSRDERAARFHT